MRVLDPRRGSSYDPDAQSVIAPTPMTQPIRHMLMPNHLETGYRPYPLLPIGGPQAVTAHPAVIDTAAVGANPWDHAYGPVGSPRSQPSGAARLAPQTSKDGF